MDYKVEEDILVYPILKHPNALKIQFHFRVNLPDALDQDINNENMKKLINIVDKFTQKLYESQRS